MSWSFSTPQLKKGNILAFQGDSAPFWKAKACF